MPWPPSADFVVNDTVPRSSCLDGFLECLLSVKSDSSENRQRLVTSFAQDICRAVTNGKWTLLKHLLLGMILQHLTGSAEVITLVSRFGHCVSYSRVIELETARCKAIDERQSVIPSTISPNRNLVTHLCWDKFDFTEETPSGAGTTHTAHGIIIQDVSTAKENISESPEEFDQGKTKS